MAYLADGRRRVVILSELRANAWKWSAVLLLIMLVASAAGVLVFRTQAIAAKAKAKAVELEAQVLADELKATQAVMAEERQKAQKLAGIADKYEQDKNDAEQTAERLRADLRSGAVRLRQHWTCPSTTAPSASEPDAGAGGREGSAARIIAAADACDAQVRGLQAIIKADRE